MSADYEAEGLSVGLDGDEIVIQPSDGDISVELRLTAEGAVDLAEWLVMAVAELQRRSRRSMPPLGPVLH